MSINYFDEIFFSNYLRREGEEVLDVCHKHIVTITDTIVIGMFFWVILPAFFYYNNSFQMKDVVPFLYFESYLFFTYVFLIYKIFDWYNDVWIITTKGIIDLDWQLFKTNVVFIDYNDVKGIELRQDTMWDGLLNKGDINIHLEGEHVFGLEEAKDPKDVINYIQEVLENKEKAKKAKDQTLTDRMFSTLRSVIKEHLEREGLEEQVPDEDDDEESPEEKALNRALRMKGTIDLREQG